MALNPTIRQMVANANKNFKAESLSNLAPSITAELARLGFEKATKRELREVIARALNSEQAP